LLFFVGPGQELWRSDGSEAGTILIQDLQPGVGGITSTVLVSFGSHVVVRADDGQNGEELWRSAGEPGDMVRLTDFVDPQPFPATLFPGFFATVGQTLLFIADEPTFGREVWRTSGDPLAAEVLLDICPGPCIGTFGLLLHNAGLVYFSGSNAESGSELFRSDGSPTGSFRIVDLCPGSCSGAISKDLVSFGEDILFVGMDGEGDDLWRTNGALGVVERVSSFSTPSPFGSRLQAVAAGGDFFFRAGDGLSAPQLWRTDGTLAGTASVPIEGLGAPSSAPTELVSLGGRLYFFADDGVRGRELWTSDGTETGTSLAAEIVPGLGSPRDRRDFRIPLQAEGRLYFEVVDPVLGHELWSSDGTQSGTLQLTAFELADPQLSFLTRLGDEAVFSASGLWRTDGTLAGTQKFHDATTPVPSPYEAPGDLFESLGDIVLFAGSLAAGDVELWRTDGTATGTFLLKEINPSDLASYPQQLKAAGDQLFFTANDGMVGFELWRSDGTTSGTMLLEDIVPGANSGYPRHLASQSSKLFFVAFDEVGEERLWWTDLTTLVSQEVDIPDGLTALADLTTFHDDLLFTARHPDFGIELWRSDGTAAGTNLVRDVRVGSRSSKPQDLVVVGDRVLFTAYEEQRGRELWCSDGTSQGTRLLADLAPGTLSSRPLFFTFVGSRLFFSARGGTHGVELWAVALPLFEDDFESGSVAAWSAISP
jgi:ELWxxDGT repeat protein